MRAAVQVIVVALILLVCGGLLGPLVIKVRDAAAQARCSNNLRSIALALHNHEATYRHFPLAAEPNPGLPPERRLSWLVSIGPFMEATNLFVRLDRDKGWDADENRYLGLTVWKVYQCSASLNRPPTSPFVPTSYVGLTGLGEDAATLPLSDPRAGFFGDDRKLAAADIKERTGTLLVAIETRQVQGAWSAGGAATVRGLVEEEPYLGPNGQLGGLHRRGDIAAFADGSARFVARSTDPRVLEALTTIKGSKTAEPISEP
jgi:hypothetical protein